MGRFCFKQFSVENRQSAMKVGTDAVLLGAWLQSDNRSGKMLDIGCGTGIISLMAAQRNPLAEITAIDIDAVSAEEAEENFINSPWKNRLNARHISLQEFCREQENAAAFDHVFSNPPYFDRSLKSDNERKMTARHNDTLPFEVMAESFRILTGEDGLLSIILPASEYGLFRKQAGEYGIYPSRVTLVKTSPDKPHKRVLAEFRKKKCQFTEHELTIQEKGEYTSGYRELTRDFHPFL